MPIKVSASEFSDDSNHFTSFYVQCLTASISFEDINLFILTSPDAVNLIKTLPQNKETKALLSNGYKKPSKKERTLLIQALNRCNYSDVINKIHSRKLRIMMLEQLYLTEQLIADIDANLLTYIDIADKNGDRDEAMEKHEATMVQYLDLESEDLKEAWYKFMGIVSKIESSLFKLF